jgi:hypothetical protein
MKIIKCFNRGQIISELRRQQWRKARLTNQIFKMKMISKSNLISSCIYKNQTLKSLFGHLILKNQKMLQII